MTPPQREVEQVISEPAACILLQRLRSAEKEVRALRIEVSSLDRRAAALEQSFALSLFRIVGGLGQTLARRVGRLLLHPRLHTLWARVYGTSQLARDYRDWLRTHRASDSLRQLPESVASSDLSFSIVLPARQPHPDWFRSAVASVLAQNYPNWQLCIGLGGEVEPSILNWLQDLARTDARIVLVQGPSGGISQLLNLAAARADGEFLVFLDQDDQLEVTALAHFAALLAARDYEIAYSDEDLIDTSGRPLRPLFKPGYSPDLLCQCMYMGRLLSVARASFLAVGGFRPEFDGAQDLDLVYRVLETGAKAGHVPRVLYHGRQFPGSTARNSQAALLIQSAGKKVIESLLQRRGLNASVADGAYPYSYRISIQPHPSAHATIIIPSRNPRLLESCLSAINSNTANSSFDILVAHHRGGRKETQMAAFLQRNQIQCVDFFGDFNFSTICNLAASKATGSILVFLNDDVFPLKPDWLVNLVSSASRPEVGVVGAQLYYPSGSIQHAGIAVGICDGAGHPGRNLFDSAYWPWINFSRNVSAVSGACFAVRRQVFEQLHGFDPQFPVNYNDVDFCLRARQAGYRIFVDTSVRLTHMEARTRKGGTLQVERLKFYRRWGHLIEAGDSFYSPNLRVDVEDLGLST